MLFLVSCYKPFFKILQWSYNGPQLEILVRSILFHAFASGKHLECSVTGDLQVNYKNIEKVLSEITLCLLFTACTSHCYCSNLFALAVNHCWCVCIKLKVSWEPFIEPWQFLLTFVGNQEMSVLPNRSLSTDIVLKSTTQLNINITESLVEVY